MYVYARTATGNTGPIQLFTGDGAAYPLKINVTAYSVCTCTITYNFMCIIGDGGSRSTSRSTRYVGTYVRTDREIT